MAPPRVRAGFIDPMLLLRAETLPNDARWSYELKLDGYRAVAFKAGRAVHIRSRNDNDFSARYPAIAAGLANLPADTAIGGEVVLSTVKAGRPSNCSRTTVPREGLSSTSSSTSWYSQGRT